MNSNGTKNKHFSLINILGAVILVGGIAVGGYSIYSMRPPAIPTSSLEASREEVIAPPPVSSSEEPESSEPENTIGGYKESELIGKLITTKEREDYKTGQMQLRIPRLELIADVVDYSVPSDLDLGPSMYEYSQLPGEGNRNVSITAHRDAAKMEFYFIDRLWEGDLFYLIYNDNIYSYVYRETFVIEPDNWMPITHQGKSMLTLISCHPLGTTKQRIVVTADFKEVIPYKNYYEFAYFEPGYEKPKAWDDITFTKRDTEQTQSSSSLASSSQPNSSSESASTGAEPNSSSQSASTGAETNSSSQSTSTGAETNSSNISNQPIQQ